MFSSLYFESPLDQICCCFLVPLSLSSLMTLQRFSNFAFSSSERFFSFSSSGSSSPSFVHLWGFSHHIREAAECSTLQWAPCADTFTVFGIYVKGYINLGDSSWSRGEYQPAGSYPGHLCLTLTDNYIHWHCLSITFVENTCFFVVGWWHHLISLVNTPHGVSITRERGVTSRGRTSVTSPLI